MVLVLAPDPLARALAMQPSDVEGLVPIVVSRSAQNPWFVSEKTSAVKTSMVERFLPPSNSGAA